MTIEEFLELFKKIVPKNTYLYFVTRILKPEIKKTDKILNKYDFNIYQIDIDDEIRNHLYNLTFEQLNKHSNFNDEISEYDVISDDVNAISKYHITDKNMPFEEVIKSLNSDVPKIENLEKLFINENLWAYCVGLYHGDEDWIYTFRKILPSKVAIDEKDGESRNAIQKSLRTMFNTKSSKLELIEGDTINLDRQVDCFYYKDIFYILRKAQFEQIVGLEEEFKNQANEVLKELENLEVIVDISFLRNQLVLNPSLHKKFVRLGKIGNYKDINSKVIRKLMSIAKKFGHTLKINDNKLIIEDLNDVDIILRLFADYYKEGKVSGKSYGTYAGKQID